MCGGRGRRRDEERRRSNDGGGVTGIRADRRFLVDGVYVAGSTVLQDRRARDSRCGGLCTFRLCVPVFGYTGWSLSRIGRACGRRRYCSAQTSVHRTNDKTHPKRESRRTKLRNSSRVAPRRPPSPPHEEQEATQAQDESERKHDRRDLALLHPAAPRRSPRARPCGGRQRRRA